MSSPKLREDITFQLPSQSKAAPLGKRDFGLDFKVGIVVDGRHWYFQERRNYLQSRKHDFSFNTRPINLASAS